MEAGAKELVRGALRLLTDYEVPRAVVTLGEIKIVGGDKARIEGKVTAPNVSDYRELLGDRVNTKVTLIAADPETFMGERAPAQTDPDQLELPSEQAADDEDRDGEPKEGQDEEPAADPLIDKAATLMRTEGETTLAFLQKALKVGYARARRLMAQLEARGVVSVPDENGHRHIKRDGGTESA